METAVKMLRLGVNDEFVTLVEWMVDDGSFVHSNQVIANIETTKESSELTAGVEGYIHFFVAQDTEVRVGDTVAMITDTKEYSACTSNTDLPGKKITDKARTLIEKYKINLSSFSSLSIIREKDVLALIGNQETICRSKANDLIIVCGGGLSKMAIDLIRLNKAYNIHGFVDDNPKTGADLLGVPYLGKLETLGAIYAEGFRTAVNANGSICIDNQSDTFHRRWKIFDKIKGEGYFLPALIHPSAVIAPSAQLGEGDLVFENAVIGSDAIIGDDCIINTGAIISHDCQIGNHSRISPGAVLAGNVSVGENTLIGMGVTVYLGVKIGKNVIISNGQNIMGDVPDGTVIK